MNQASLYWDKFLSYGISLVYGVSFVVFLTAATVLGYFIGVAALALTPILSFLFLGVLFINSSQPNNEVLLDIEQMNTKTSNVTSIDTYVRKHNFHKDIGIINYAYQEGA